MTIRVLDIETTGIDPEQDAIIEIASVDVTRASGDFVGTSTYDIVRLLDTLVVPGRPIPPEASAVHHIVDADMVDARPLPDAIGMFNDADAYVAHNCAFERGFLDRHFGEKPWVCTFKCALRVWPDAPGHSNQVLRYWLGLIEPFGRPRQELPTHRALSDAIVTAAIFVELLKRASWADLQAWSQEPARFTTFSFGKHRGQKYADVPSDYLDWIIFKSDLDADTKASARYWRDQRRGGAA
jgi:exodeoxyribonuclease X